MSKLPTVFVSSTCFDLSQVRHDMKQFIETIGYEPLLSEFDSFGYSQFCMGNLNL